jgi:dTDP-4-amino-4,6-dideoxygalactose transaminase
VLPPYDKSEKHHVAEKLASQGVNLPTSVNLDKATVKHIVDTATRILEP